jgi:hypothetical protein
VDERTEQRFWAKVNKTETCWLWTAYVSPKGYGTFSFGGKACASHRFSYQMLIGPIPDGLQIDHLCRVRHCVNPAHLEPVTSLENSRRGIAGLVTTLRQKSKTHCPRGHPYDEANTYTYPRTGARRCRACHRLEANERAHAKREAAA